MIAPWMVYSMVVTALIGLAALSGEVICRRLGWPQRWIWPVALAAALSLSVAALVRLADPAPADVVGSVTLSPTTVSTIGTNPGALSRFGALAVEARNASARVADQVYAVAAASGADRGLAIAWAVASGILVLLTTWTVSVLGMLRRRWRPARIDGIDLLVSSDSGPAVVGLFRPVIVVPSWLLAEPVARRRMVVAHEDEHRRAGDHVVIALACVAACLQPWNAGLWWMLRRLRLAIELDCDRRVLKRGASPREYGLLLLEMAGRSRAGLRGVPAPALADGTTHLERRIIAMTEKRGARHALRTTVAAGLTLALSVAACTTDLPTAETIDGMDVARAESAAAAAGLVRVAEGDTEPVFMIDSVIVEAAVARKLAPSDIESIEIRKATELREALVASSADAGVVSVTTRKAALARAAESEVALRAVEVAGRPSGQDVEVLPSKITLREVAGQPARREIEERQAAAQGQLRALTADGKAPLLLIDGVVASSGVTLQSLDKESIESVEVLKGEAATRQYDHPRAANGVILITTKRVRR